MCLQPLLLGVRLFKQKPLGQAQMMEPQGLAALSGPFLIWRRGRRGSGGPS